MKKSIIYQMALKNFCFTYECGFIAGQEHGGASALQLVSDHSSVF